MTRKAISKKDRFEVFKRDSFICQYCGRSAPDVILVIDHIQPVSKGGENNITNYITSCQDCNSGKSNRELSDDTVIQKRKAQLDELQERREQLEMMLKWQNGLIKLDEEILDKAVNFFDQLIDPFSLNDIGRETVRKFLKKHDFSEILDCMRISASQYLKRDEEDNLIQESASKALDYVVRIANARRRMEKKPYLRDLYYIRGIIRNRMYCNDWVAIKLLEDAYLLGIDIDDLKAMAMEERNWTNWRTIMESLIKDNSNEQ